MKRLVALRKVIITGYNGREKQKDGGGQEVVVRVYS
jgi:hypothetical protein